MPSLSGLVSGLDARGAQNGEWFYLWNGRNRMRKYNGVAWRNAGIANTDFTPTLAVATKAGAGLTGTFYYYVQAVNSQLKDGWNRPCSAFPSTLAGPISPVDQMVTVSNIPTTHADPQVDKFYIYRTLNGKFSASLEDADNYFYKVGEVAIGTDHMHDEADDDTLVDMIRFNRQLPPTFRCAVPLGGRLLGFGFKPYTTGKATVNATTTLIDFSGGASIPDGFLGCYFKKDGGGAQYEITAVNSATQITVDPAFVGTLSAEDYSIYLPGNKVFISEDRDWDAWGPAGYAYRWLLDVPGGKDATAGINIGQGAYIFTLDEIHLITGQGSNIMNVRFQPQPLYQGVGCVGRDALCAVDTAVYFMSLRGPMRFQVGMEKPEAIGDRLAMEELLASLAPAQLEYCQCGTNGREVHFALPSLGNTENDRVYVYDIQRDLWRERRYIHPTAFISMRNTAGKPKLFWGQGKYILEDAVNNGVQDCVAGATVRGTVSAGSTTTTLVASAATFYTTGGGLCEAYVHVLTAAGAYRGSGRITSNTGTVLTCSAGFKDDAGAAVTPVTGNTFEVGGRWWHKTKTFEIPGRSNTVQRMLVGIDGVDSATNLHKVETINESVMTDEHTIPADKVQSGYQIHVANGLYAAKIENRRSGSTVGLRYMQLQADQGSTEEK